MKLHLPSVLIGVAFWLGMAMASPAPQVIQPISCCLTQAQRDVLALLSVETLDDCFGGPGYKTLRVTGANLQVVNGLGTTDTENGLGNILVGYQESQAVVCDRTGSHNVVGGLGNAYGSYGGMVFGQNNYVDAGFSAILSGSDNAITVTPSTQTPSSAILAGQWNTVSSDHAAIVAGGFNNIDGFAGDINAGRWSAILGGGGSSAITGNLMEGTYSAIVGGNRNFVDDGLSVGVVVGGQLNSVTGTAAVVSGGQSRSATGIFDWVAGSLFEDN